MAETRDPVVLELALLPREQAGPFLLLGVDKDAGPGEIDAGWARRVIWARKGQTRVPLEDVNWAREVLRDSDRRVKADATSLNLDTAAGLLRRWCDAFGVGPSGEPAVGWVPYEDVPPWPEETDEDVPDAGLVRAGVTVPEVPFAVPAAGRLLDDMVAGPLDPWAIDGTEEGES